MDLPPDCPALATAPLLDGAEAALAERAVLAVAAMLQREEVLSALAAGLSRGIAGLALFYGYLALHRPGEGWEAVSEEMLGLAVERLAAEAQPHFGFFAGYTGVGWAVDHLQARLFGEGEDYNTAIDEAALDFLEHGVRPAHFDLINGAAGSGVYGLGRLRKGRGREIAARAVRLLESEARPMGVGLSWLTPPEFITLGLDKLNPQGWYDLGPAHGIPGVLGFLGLALEADVEADRALRLLEGGMDWLLSQRRPEGGPRFHRTISFEGVPAPTRSKVNWCYGDLGVSVALAGAARRAGRLDWEGEALAMARTVAAYTTEDVAITEPHLCHGAMGAAQLFHSLHSATGEALFRTAALRWYSETLSFWMEQDQAFRFPRSKEADPEAPSPWVLSAGFLIGAAGVALGLMAGLGAVAPAWRRLLMADIPARA